VTNVRKPATKWARHYARGLQAVASIFCLPAIAIAVTLIASTSAASQVLVKLDIIGGPGGNYFEHVCGPGRVLVGVSGDAGVWIDNVQAVCARLDGSVVSDAHAEGQVFGGNGGEHPNISNCPGDTKVAGLEVELNKDKPFLGSIKPICSTDLISRNFSVPALKGTGRLASEPGSRLPGFVEYGAAASHQECPRGLVAVGILGRASQFVDALGLICGPKPPSVADMSGIFLGKEVSFQSSNYPDRFIRHRNSLGFIEPIPDELGKNDASFKIVSGLAERCVSFESHNYQHHFLRHQASRLKLAQFSNDQLFAQDATFCMVSGLADSAGTSFESVNYPGHYIRHKNFELWLDRYDGTDQFRKDATFRVTQPGGRVNVR